VHKSERVREMIEGAGAQVLYLPPYSPDFNPIEEAIREVSEEDAKAFFEHCGYREAVQLL
jgi:transposase